MSEVSIRLWKPNTALWYQIRCNVSSDWKKVVLISVSMFMGGKKNCQLEKWPCFYNTGQISLEQDRIKENDMQISPHNAMYSHYLDPCHISKWDMHLYVSVYEKDKHFSDQCHCCHEYPIKLCWEAVEAKTALIFKYRYRDMYKKIGKL